jgi:hypothetical protein
MGRCGTCYKVVPINTKTIAQLELVQYFLEFWNGNAMDRKGSVLSVDVFAPSHWTVECYLEALENSASRKHGAITILKVI